MRQRGDIKAARLQIKIRHSFPASVGSGRRRLSHRFEVGSPVVGVENGNERGVPGSWD